MGYVYREVDAGVMAYDYKKACPYCYMSYKPRDIVVVGIAKLQDCVCAGHDNFHCCKLCAQKKGILW